MYPEYCLTEWYKKKVPYPLDNKVSYFEENKNPGLVYVIRNACNGLFKIGISRSIHQRIAKLQSQSGCYMDLFLSIELHSGYDESPEEIENNLHIYFKKKRLIGEWFSLDIKDLIRVRNLFYFIEGEYIEDNIKFHLSNDKDKMIEIKTFVN